MGFAREYFSISLRAFYDGGFVVSVYHLLSSLMGFEWGGMSHGLCGSCEGGFCGQTYQISLLTFLSPLVFLVFRYRGCVGEPMGLFFRCCYIPFFADLLWL